MKKLLLILFLFTGITHGQAIINSYAHTAVGGGGGAVPIVESYTQTDCGDVDTYDAPPPSGIADDDILLMVVASDAGSDTDPTSTGFTLLSGTKNTNAGKQSYVLWKRASSESGNYTVDLSVSEKTMITILRISGALDTGSPFDVVGAFNDESYLNENTSPSITTTVDNTLAISYCTADQGYVIGSGTTVTGTGWVKIMDGAGTAGSGSVSFIMAEKDMDTAGATGTVLYDDFGTNDGSSAQTINIKSN